MIPRLLDALANAFPLWVLLALVGGLAEPDLFTWFGPYITPGLTVIMLGMGMTLTAADFAAVLRTPRAVAVGFAAQYTIMPFMGWAVATGMGLERDFAVGVILVACCPGGTASNVVTYLARANVPLSVLMTMCSTIAAVVLTPLLTRWLAGALVPVDAPGMLLSIATVVLLPVAGGVLLNRYLPDLVRAVVPAGPLVSVLTIALIVGAIVGANAGPIRENGVRLTLAVAALHAGGFALGYFFSRAFGYGITDSRTISIEVGMQNSGLGTALAKKHFADPATGVALAAVPCAISAVMHSVMGSLLAGAWRLFPDREREADKEKVQP